MPFPFVQTLSWVTPVSALWIVACNLVWSDQLGIYFQGSQPIYRLLMEDAGHPTEKPRRSLPTAQARRLVICVSQSLNNVITRSGTLGICDYEIWQLGTVLHGPIVAVIKRPGRVVVKIEGRENLVFLGDRVD